MKKFLIVLLVIILVIALGALVPPMFMKSSSEFQNSTMVGAKSSLVFEQVNNLRKWSAWSPWKEADPEMMSEYEGPRSGEGAVHKWTSESQGDGVMTITTSEPDSKIETSIDFGERGTGKGVWLFEETGDSVKVTWKFITGDMGYIGRWFGVLMQGMMNDMMEKGLSNLKEVAENEQRTYTEKGFDKVSAVKVQPQKAISILDSTTMKTIDVKMGELYSELGMFIGQNKIKPAGAPFCIYHTYEDEGMYAIEAGFPVSDKVETTGRINMMEMYTGNAIKMTHVGSYDKLNESYTVLMDYMEYEGLEGNGAPWEVYFNDPMTEKDPSKFTTDIYFPVK